MPLIVTPRQLSRRAELYHQIGSMMTAGVSLISTLEMLHRKPPSASFREPLQLLVHRLEQGDTFADAIEHTGDWIPAFDRALLRAGEQSGRLDACFKLLAIHYQERSSLVRLVMGELTYPFFLIHLAALVFPVQGLIQMVWHGNITGFVMQKGIFFGCLYGAIILLAYLCRSNHGEVWRYWLERLSNGIPLLGKARRNLALGRVAAALEAELNAGVNIIHAWELAGAASGSPGLRRTIDEWRPRIEAGAPPSEAVIKSGMFPELFANLYLSGEMSGQLDDTLKRLHHHYQEEGSRQSRAFTQWTVRLVFLGIMAGIGYEIIKFWAGYFSQFNFDDFGGGDVDF